MIASFNRALLLGLNLHLLGYPVYQDKVNYQNVVILLVFLFIFKVTDVIAENKAKQVLTDEE